MHKHFFKLQYNNALREVIKLFLNALTGKLNEDPTNYWALNFLEISDFEPKRGNNIAGIPIERVVDTRNHIIFGLMREYASIPIRNDSYLNTFTAYRMTIVLFILKRMPYILPRDTCVTSKSR